VCESSWLRAQRSLHSCLLRHQADDSRDARMPCSMLTVARDQHAVTHHPHAVANGLWTCIPRLWPSQLLRQQHTVNT
jgi:hypothetical protein